jgi:ATP-dependent DNA helicase RecG
MARRPGLRADQLNLAGLPGLVAARASPSLAVQVEAIEINGVPVARLVVPKARSVVATNGGVYPRRRIKHDGKPECVPPVHVLLENEALEISNSGGLVDGVTLANLSRARATALWRTR